MAGYLLQRRLLSNEVQQWTYKLSGFIDKLQGNLAVSETEDSRPHLKILVNVVQKRLMSNAMQEFAYKLSGFQKYGLMRDDCLDDEDEDVIEALRRLNPEIRDARNFRLLKAMQLSLQRDILPKKEWMTLDKDELYLTPLVNQVIKEREEKEEWSKRY